jgi:hypothetical protein
VQPGLQEAADAAQDLVARRAAVDVVDVLEVVDVEDEHCQRAPVALASGDG